jgi:hypothetical protein
MAHPVAVVFAITMAVWVADVRLAPQAPAPESTSAASCKSGPSATAPADADLEIVVCAPR